MLNTEPSSRRNGYECNECWTTRSVDTLLRYGAIESRRNGEGETPSSHTRDMLRIRILTRGPADEEDQQNVNAILRSLARGPVFRARSLLWPRAAVKGKNHRPWKEYPVFAWRRGQQKQKRFSFASIVSRYVRQVVPSTQSVLLAREVDIVLCHDIGHQPDRAMNLLVYCIWGESTTSTT